jgi:hypothetical protein
MIVARNDDVAHGSDGIRFRFISPIAMVPPWPLCGVVVFDVDDELNIAIGVEVPDDVVIVEEVRSEEDGTGEELEMAHVAARCGELLALPLDLPLPPSLGGDVADDAVKGSRVAGKCGELGGGLTILRARTVELAILGERAAAAPTNWPICV